MYKYVTMMRCSTEKDVSESASICSVPGFPYVDLVIPHVNHSRMIGAVHVWRNRDPLSVGQPTGTAQSLAPNRQPQERMREVASHTHLCFLVLPWSFPHRHPLSCPQSVRFCRVLSRKHSVNFPCVFMSIKPRQLHGSPF